MERKERGRTERKETPSIFTNMDRHIPQANRDLMPPGSRCASTNGNAKQGDSCGQLSREDDSDECISGKHYSISTRDYMLD